jgi:hypothetical protein
VAAMNNLVPCDLAVSAGVHRRRLAAAVSAP